MAINDDRNELHKFIMAVGYVCALDGANANAKAPPWIVWYLTVIFDDRLEFHH